MGERKRKKKKEKEEKGEKMKAVITSHQTPAGNLQARFS